MGRYGDEQAEQLRRGIQLDDGPTRPAEVQRVRDSGAYSFLDLTITEGRNRQVRRMVEAIDSKVMKLVRTAIGPIQIGEVRVAAGDLVVADDTGVCFIPRDVVLEVLEAAEQKASAEAARCKAIDGGIPVPDISRATYGEKT